MKTLLRKILTLLVTFILTGNLFASTIYVSSVATGSNDGTSWANAYTSLQSALNTAVSGDQIWVAKGTYKPSYDYGLGGGSRYYHFEMINGVAIYGGFSGTETDVAQRTNYQMNGANETILNGDLLDNDSWDDSYYDRWVGAIKGTTGNDNCYHVIFNPASNGITTSAIIDGFTIRGGNASYPSNTSPHIRGGGIYNSGASPTIRNCTFTKNQAYVQIENKDEFLAFGSCIFSENSNPVVSNCLFDNNFTNISTISCFNGGVTISDCIFTHNKSYFSNVGIHVLANDYPSSITNCSFSNNDGSSQAMVLFTEQASDVTIRGCSFTGNNSAKYVGGSAGGALGNLFSTNIEITNCSFTSNNTNNSSGTGGGGGAIANCNSSEVKINNCIFNGNTAQWGGAILNTASTCTVTNSSFSNNTGTTAGGAVLCYRFDSEADDGSGFITLNNCVFGNNSSPSGNQLCSDGQYDENHCKIEVNYSCFPNGAGDLVQANGGTILATNNNIHTNPLFVDAANGNFQLYGNSPCVNTGNNSYNKLGTDLRGQTRIQNTTIDMGAYEWTSGVDPVNNLPTKIENLQLYSGISVYPNPSSNVINFRLTPENDGKTTIDILTLSGQLVYRAFEGITEKGKQQIIQFTQPLSEGIYIYRLSNGLAVKTGRLIRLSKN